jgi:hypothetical protein
MQKLFDRYQLSTANLTAFRCLLAVGFIFHLCFYIYPSIDLFYTKQALLPPVWVLGTLKFPLISIFSLSLPKLIVQAIFGFTIILALLFMIGRRARLVAILLWICLWNIYQTGFFVSGAEKQMGMSLLAFAIFLPLSDSKTKAHPLLVFLLMLQLFWIYFSASLLKGAQWYNTSILDTIISADLLNSRQFWLEHPLHFSKFWNYAIILSELFISILLLTYNHRNIVQRWLIFVLIFGLHTGITFFLKLEQFYFFELAIMSLFIPFQRKQDLEILNNFSFKPHYILIVIFSVVVAISNLKTLVNGSILSPLMKQIKVKAVLNKIPSFQLEYSSGLQQNWALYREIPDTLGIVYFCGITKADELVNLLGQKIEPQKTIFIKNRMQKEFYEIQRIQYFFSKQLYTHEKIAGELSKKWNAQFPNHEIVQTQIRFYFFDKGQANYKILKSFPLLETD